MLSASRSWLYVPTLRRLYTTPTTKPRPKFTWIPIVQYDLPKISTLRPEKLVHSDFLVFAGRERPSFHTELSYNNQMKQKKRRHATGMAYQSHVVPVEDKAELKGGNVGATASGKEVGEIPRVRSVHSPFPESAQGFLYLHQPPPESGLPRSACSIRFRCTPSLVEASSSYVASLGGMQKLRLQAKARTDPLVLLPSSITNREIYEAFKAGYDLTVPSDTLWSTSIDKVAGRPILKYIRKQLVADELSSESEMQEYEDLYKNTNITQESNSLNALDDVFIVRFDRLYFVVWNTAEKVERAEGAGQAVPKKMPYIKPRSSVLKNAFVDLRPEYDNKPPYTGAARVRFELAPGSNPSSPALYLRIVKITEPVECVIPDYDGYVHIPKEGELVMFGSPDKPEPWICRIDPSKSTESAILSLVLGYAPNLNANTNANVVGIMQEA